MNKPKEFVDGPRYEVRDNMFLGYSKEPLYTSLCTAITIMCLFAWNILLILNMHNACQHLEASGGLINVTYRHPNIRGS